MSQETFRLIRIISRQKPWLIERTDPTLFIFSRGKPHKLRLRCNDKSQVTFRLQQPYFLMDPTRKSKLQDGAALKTLRLITSKPPFNPQFLPHD